jgi:hypothetical protein
MEKLDTRVILVAGDGGWSECFDKKRDLERLSNNTVTYGQTALILLPYFIKLKS